MFWVSFLQQLPQQMPEMSRCPNGTKCFHNKTRVKGEQAYIRLSPPAPGADAIFLPCTNTHSPGYLKRAAEKSPRRAAPGNGTWVSLTLFTSLWGGGGTGHTGLQQDPRATDPGEGGHGDPGPEGNVGGGGAGRTRP